MIQRQLLGTMIERMQGGKAILLIGARQVGKTTLLHQTLSCINEQDSAIMWLNCDQQEVRNALNTTNLNDLKLLVGNASIVVIDEAQRVDDIGLTLKIIVDNMPHIRLLVTGSSAFELRNKVNEPLTGRKETYYLYPLSAQEIYDVEGLVSMKEQLRKQLIYGTYPAVFLSNEPEKILMELSESYLYKDILEIEGLRRISTLEKLLIALALQVGSEVSYNELAKTIGIDRKTVEKYIDLLEKCYVIFHLNSFNRNIRTELTKGKKIYFYDNGIRNAILRQFAPIELRQDMGALWENFFIAERVKYNHYNGRYINSYFWRTSNQQEIDYIEEDNGQLTLFELKWNVNKQNTRFPNLFMETYKPVQTNVITPNNYLQFLMNV